MDTTIKNYKFNIDNKEILFEIKINNLQNIVILKSYKPLGDAFFRDATWTWKVDIEEFEEDLSILLPNDLIFTDINSLMFFQLTKRIKLHTEKYGRLLIDDLETYIDETILLIEAISKVLKNNIPNEEEKKKIFINFKNRILNKS